jgi:hypothetical protein
LHDAEQRLVPSLGLVGHAQAELPRQFWVQMLERTKESISAVPDGGM